MTAAQTAIDVAIREVSTLRDFLNRSQSAQVRSPEELSVVKATALAWFNNHRTLLEVEIGLDGLRSVDEGYKELLRSSDKHPSRSKCRGLLKDLKKNLSAVRVHATVNAGVPATGGAGHQPPNFSKLVADTKMQTILTGRWDECSRCISAGAWLAATVMMGGLLEGLLLARVNTEVDQSKVMNARAAPKEKTTGKARPLQAWNLKDFIAVASELGWITPPARDLGTVLRDYRNFIHPEKQFSAGVTFQADDVAMFWEVAKGICRQLIASAP